MRGLAAAAACCCACLCSDAVRTVPSEAARKGPPMLIKQGWQVDVSKIKTDGGAVAHDQKSAEVAIQQTPNGDVIIGSGVKLVPFDGIPPEADLGTEAFTCYGRRLFGITLPGIASPQETFHYMQRDPFPNLEPIEIYNDLGHDWRHLMVYPPKMFKGQDEWMLWSRTAKGPGKEGFAEQRLFRLGRLHPCDPRRAEEAKAAEARPAATATGEREAPVGRKPSHVAAADVPRGGGGTDRAQGAPPVEVADSEGSTESSPDARPVEVADVGEISPTDGSRSPGPMRESSTFTQGSAAIPQMFAFRTVGLN